MIKIKLVKQIPGDVEEKMRKDLGKYENSHGIEINYQQFALLLTNDHNKTIGVLNAYTAFAEVYIEDMWIDSNHRRLGYGKKLIEELENHFTSKGFNNINLVTSQFQAPEFYKNCGFTLEFVRKNNQNPKLTKYFFIKYFNEKLQFQGSLR